MIKIGRNEQCPCGSGLKYKKCCLVREDITFDKQDNLWFPKYLSTARRESRVKECIHPDNFECSNRVINAHSIQNNGILNKLSQNGEVISFTVNYERGLEFTEEKKGKKIASVFSGFCGYHDKETFKEIEDSPFLATKKQLFLLAYRAFSYQYIKQQEGQNLIRYAIQKQPSLIKRKPESLELLRSFELGHNDGKEVKKYFDRALSSDDFELLDYVLWQYDLEAGFAATSASAIEYDLDDNLLNDTLSMNDTRLKRVFFNAFPKENQTFVLFAWLKDDSAYFKEYKSQLLSLSKSEQIQYINNFVPANTENIFLSPILWDAWSELAKSEFLFKLEADFIQPLHDAVQRSMLIPTEYSLFESY